MVEKIFHYAKYTGDGWFSSTEARCGETITPDDIAETSDSMNCLRCGELEREDRPSYGEINPPLDNVDLVGDFLREQVEESLLGYLGYQTVEGENDSFRETVRSTRHDDHRCSFTFRIGEKFYTVTIRDTLV